MEDATVTLRYETISEIIALAKNPVLDGLNAVYRAAKDANQVPRYMLRDFQLALKRISEWSVSAIDKELERFDVARLEELVARLQAMGATDLVLRDLVHEAYLSVARELWRKPYLMYDDVPRREFQDNQLVVEKIVVNALKQLLRRATQHILTAPPPVPAPAPEQQPFQVPAPSPPLSITPSEPPLSRAAFSCSGSVPDIDTDDSDTDEEHEEARNDGGCSSSSSSECGDDEVERRSIRSASPAGSVKTVSLSHSCSSSDSSNDRDSGSDSGSDNDSGSDRDDDDDDGYRSRSASRSSSRSASSRSSSRSSNDRNEDVHDVEVCSDASSSSGRSSRSTKSSSSSEHPQAKARTKAKLAKAMALYSKYYPIKASKGQKAKVKEASSSKRSK